VILPSTPAPDAVNRAAVDLHEIAVEEAYRLVAMYLHRLQQLGENPLTLHVVEPCGTTVSVIRGWSRELVFVPPDGTWQLLDIAAVDRDGDDRTGLYPYVDQMRREAADNNPF
jgi:hypothetical protein